MLGAAVLFGTGLGTAFHGLLAFVSGDPRVVRVAGRSVVLADGLFTAPAVLLQPITGVLLARQAGYPLTSPWLLLALGLYVMVGACWLPVLWLQLRLRALADAAAAAGAALPPAYFRCLRWWVALGWPAFAGMLAIFWLMIAKPDLVP